MDRHLYTLLAGIETSEQNYKYFLCCRRSGKVSHLRTSHVAFLHAGYNPRKYQKTIKIKSNPTNRGKIRFWKILLGDFAFTTKAAFCPYFHFSAKIFVVAVNAFNWVPMIISCSLEEMRKQVSRSMLNSLHVCGGGGASFLS